MDMLMKWLLGDLSASARIWTALAPALLLVIYFFGGIPIYAIRCRFKGNFHDKELENRDATILTGVWIRLYFAWLMQPLWRFVLRTGVPATAITTLSVLLASGSGVATAAGRFALGGWLYIFAGICDFLDGRLARIRGSNSKEGGALDSILDRYSDSVVLVGLAWFYRDSWVLIAVLLALVGSSLVPYIRARGEVEGITMTVGLMQRAERILYLGGAVALSPILEVVRDPFDPKPFHYLAVVGIVLMAVSTQVTAVQRMVHLLRALRYGPGYVAPKRTSYQPLMRNLIASFVATALDFALVWLLVDHGLSAPAATAFGCGFGAITNFSMNRVWAFASTGAKLPQMWRYGFVSFTSALLNSGGVALLLLLPAVDFRIAWVLVRIGVYLTWNFPLHRDYVFVSDKPDALDVGVRAPMENA